MHSALYFGRVRHRRFASVAHRFDYRLMMAYVDLDELPAVFAGRWLWSVERPNLMEFRRADYLRPVELALPEAVRQRVTEALGHAPTGPVRLLTQLRSWGYVFNPISLYFCFDRSGERCEAVVVEVTNIPWLERQSYVIDCVPGEDDQGRSAIVPLYVKARFAKGLHVSPFLPMNLTYRLSISGPAEQLNVHLAAVDEHDQTQVDATLCLRRQPITGWTLAAALLRFPMATLRIVAGIHWQALRLWCKRVPVVPHPKHRDRPLTTVLDGPPARRTTP